MPQPVGFVRRALLWGVWLGVLLALSLVCACDDPTKPKCEPNNNVTMEFGSGINSGQCSGVATQFPIMTRIWVCTYWSQVKGKDVIKCTMKWTQYSGAPSVQTVTVPDGHCGPYTIGFPWDGLAATGTWRASIYRNDQLCAERIFTLRAP